LSVTQSAVAGASSPDYHEYYPNFSSDGKLLVFTRAPNMAAGAQTDSYDNSDAQI
jgi:hypothetical protein